MNLKEQMQKDIDVNNVGALISEFMCPSYFRLLGKIADEINEANENIPKWIDDYNDHPEIKKVLIEMHRAELTTKLEYFKRLLKQMLG